MGQHFIKKPFRILVAVKSTFKTHRTVIRAAAKYSQLNGSWSLYVIEGRDDELELSQIDLNQFDGAVIYPTEQLSEFTQNLVLGRFDKPLLIIDPWYNVDFYEDICRQRNNISVAWCDNRAIARQCAKFLLQKNLHNFAFVPVQPPKETLWSEERKLYFVEYLKRRNIQCDVFHTQEQNFESQTILFQKWLRDLPKPIGIAAATDSVARRVVEGCLYDGIKIPDEAAVIGIDNDELICESTTPSISSLENDLEGTVVKLLEIMDRQIRGESFSGRTFYYEPARIVERVSTQMNITSDRTVIRSMELIRLNVGRPFGVAELARHVNVSRRTLELRFKKNLGKSVHDVIIETKLDKAKKLLCESNLSIAEIAHSCGFSNENYFATAFKRQYKLSPTSFRKIL